MAQRVSHFRLTLDWDPVSKRWKLVYVVQLKRGVASHWRWVDSRAQVDALSAAQIATAVTRELESHLF